MIEVTLDTVRSSASLHPMALKAYVYAREQHVGGLLTGWRLLMARSAGQHAVRSMIEDTVYQPSSGDCRGSHRRKLVREHLKRVAFLALLEKQPLSGPYLSGDRLSRRLFLFPSLAPAGQPSPATLFLVFFFLVLYAVGAVLDYLSTEKTPQVVDDERVEITSLSERR